VLAGLIQEIIFEKADAANAELVCIVCEPQIEY
jgi:hypothetical protein